MLNPETLVKLYGNPILDSLTFERQYMILWDIPQVINTAIPHLPNKIYCHKLLVPRLEIVFNALIDKNLQDEIKTYNGCFCPRLQRGSKNISIHSWALAIDLNAEWNRLGGKVNFSQEFIQVWRENGFDCGADFKLPRTDGMHFQLKQL